ncbi:MAG TPA: RidA family protein [Anaerolineales bacterium]|nr:RidA family protein [Anaerolineales bacterium]
MPDRITIKPYDSYHVSTFVIQGEIVYIGHFGGSYDDEGNKLLSAEAQTLQTFRNLEKALKEINLGLDNLLKVTVILKDIADFDAMHNAWKQVFSKDYPVRTTVTSNFVDDHCRVQIEGIAYMNGSEK